MHLPSECFEYPVDTMHGLRWFVHGHSEETIAGGFEFYILVILDQFRNTHTRALIVEELIIDTHLPRAGWSRLELSQPIGELPSAG